MFLLKQLLYMAKDGWYSPYLSFLWKNSQLNGTALYIVSMLLIHLFLKPNAESTFCAWKDINRLHFIFRKDMNKCCVFRSTAFLCNVWCSTRLCSLRQKTIIEGSFFRHQSTGIIFMFITIAVYKTQVFHNWIDRRIKIKRTAAPLYFGSFFAL